MLSDWKNAVYFSIVFVFYIDTKKISYFAPDLDRIWYVHSDSWLLQQFKL